SLELGTDPLVLLLQQLRVGPEPQADAAAQCLRQSGQVALTLQRPRQRFAEPELADAQSLIHRLAPRWPCRPRTASPAAWQPPEWWRGICSRRPSRSTAHRKWLHHAA